MGGVTFWQNFHGELMWNRQPTHLSSHNPIDNSYAFASNMNLDMYQFDLRNAFRNIGGGVKYYFGRHWGVRAEIRWSPSHTTQGESIYCDSIFGCAQCPIDRLFRVFLFAFFTLRLPVLYRSGKAPCSFF
jgi:hypothetical protein